MITQFELHRILDYNPNTGIFRWKISPKYGIKIGNIAGTINKGGHIYITIKGKQYKAHRLAWLYEYGYFPENQIDHKDRVGHHNWISNLREVSGQCNIRNTGNFKHNTSGVKGIYWNTSCNRWQAYIKINQKQNYIGVFKDFDEAVCHRLAAEQCVGWSGCDNSSPAFQYVQKVLGK